MKKQTAVEWLEEQYYESEGKLTRHDFEQYKQMEKEQMDNVSVDWWNEGASYMYDGKRKYNSFEQYYNETYGGTQ